MAKRKGRIRKANAERVPGTGRLSRAGHEAVGLSNAEIRRYKIIAGAEFNQLALLRLRGEEDNGLSEAEHRAGVRFRELHSKYQRALGIKPLRAAGLESGVSGSAPDPDSLEGQNIAEREEKAVVRWNEACACLYDAERRAVFDLVIRDMLLPWAERRLAKGALASLAREFGYARSARAA